MLWTGSVIGRGCYGVTVAFKEGDGFFNGSPPHNVLHVFFSGNPPEVFDTVIVTNPVNVIYLRKI